MKIPNKVNQYGNSYFVLLNHAETLRREKAHDSQNNKVFHGMPDM